MNTFDQIKQLLADLLDVTPRDITPETYLVRDLGAESIDFLELAVALDAGFNIQVNDDELFLKRVRGYAAEAEEGDQDPFAAVAVRYPFLSNERLREILADLDAGPVLKVMDIVRYVTWQTERAAKTA